MEAQEYALSSISHVRIEFLNHSILVRFGMGKTRLASIKRIAIPNTKLQTAVYEVKVEKFLNEDQSSFQTEFLIWQHYSPVLYESTCKAPEIFWGNSIE